MQFCCGKQAPSTAIAVKVDGKESPLPHIIDKNTGTEKSVSIDRLKAYFVQLDQIQTSTNEADEEPPSSSSSEAKSKDESTKSRVHTRAGREVKHPDRFY